MANSTIVFPKIDSLSIMESLEDGVVIFDRNWTYVYLNNKAVKMFGGTEESRLGKNLWKMFPYLKNNIFGKNCLKAVRQNISLDFEYHSLAHGRWYENKIIPSGDNIIIFFKDVSDRKRYQEGLEFLTEAGKVLASSLDYQKTLKAVSRLIVPKISDWFAVDILTADKKLEQVVVGHIDPKKVVFAKKLRKLFPPDLNQDQGVGKVLRTGKPEFYPHINQELLKASVQSKKHLKILENIGMKSVIVVPLAIQKQIIGTVTLVSAESGRIYDETDVDIALQLADRIAQVIHNAKIFQTVQDLASIVESSDDAIIKKKLDFTVTNWNKGAEKLYGYKEKEAIGKKILDLIVPEGKREEFLKAMAKVKKGVAVGPLETLRRHKNGSLIDISLKLSPIYDAMGKVVGSSVIARDISMIKEFERRKDTFIGVASHELKTPVTSMKAYAEILIRKLDDLDKDELKKYLQKVGDQIDKLIELVSELLDLSRIQSGKLEIDKQEFNLTDFIKETIEDLERVYDSHKIDISYKDSIYIKGDKNRLSQVITNLISNAVKYSPGEEKIVIDYKRSDDCVLVSVQDFGIGIDKKYHGRIFERFFRTKDTDARKIPGLGIGLFISSEIVKQHGGKMWVENGRKKGTIFKFTIPL